MRFTPVKRSITKMLDIKSMRMLDNYCHFNPSPLTLKHFIEFGQTATEEQSFHFIKKEVPVRVANIMKEINLLPSILLQMPSMVTLQVSRQSREIKAGIPYLSCLVRSGTRRASWTSAPSRAAPVIATLFENSFRPWQPYSNDIRTPSRSWRRPFSS